MSKEMTPKDALRRISGFISFCCYEYFDKELEKDWKKDIDAIKQALNSVEETNFNYHNALAFCEASKEEKQELRKQIEQLEKENQELKEDLRLTTIERNVCENIYEALEEKYFKLKKVIEILKDKLNIRLHILTNTDGSKIYEIEFILGYYSTIYEITQQEYELLKEVLESV